MNGAVILHGNGETPQTVAALADAMRRENLLVAIPELPWSARRFYDRGVPDAEREIDAAVAQVRNEGARRVYLIGLGVGANFALRSAARPGVTGIVAIAPGFAPESPLFAQSFADDLRRARDFVARGRPQEVLEFLDWQWGNRRNRTRAPASSFLSYFDPAGPLNLTRSVEQIPPQTLMLWILPAQDPGAEQRANELYARAHVNPGSRIVQLSASYQSAMTPTVRAIVDWMKDSTAYIRSD
ncbi:MAG TPA: alpha/beta fold hydrolase [Burkholderiales bacterium]|nr:alpha/beta fold hydrolase [Burkholderiales bacterium]